MSKQVRKIAENYSELPSGAQCCTSIIASGPPIKQTLLIKSGPTLASYISINKEPLFSGHLY